MEKLGNVERPVSFETVLAELTGMLVEVIGEDFLVDVELSGETTFNEDLALESIEFVALAEKLQERYAGRVDFAAFIADLDIEEIMALKVGQLVTYVTGCLGSPDGMRSGGPATLEPGTPRPRLTPLRAPERAPSRGDGD